MTTKEALFLQCEYYIGERLERISAAMKDLEKDLENETKSSAGDKYETGREMINAEWNKLSGQLVEFQKLEVILKTAQSRKPSETVQLGSLVKTNAANYLVCIPAGKLTLGNEVFYAIGVNSPIAQLLLHKSEGDSFQFNGKDFRILKVE